MHQAAKATQKVRPRLRAGKGGCLSAFSLTELLAVCLILLVCSSLLMQAFAGVMATSALSECAHRLRTTGIAFQQYRQDYGDYPTFAPPEGLGDLRNWGDLWSGSDYPGGFYFSPLPQTKTVLGQSVTMAAGNWTQCPRVPRLLAGYTDSVDPLHCNGVGSSQFWPDVGPYYYHTSQPQDEDPPDPIRNDGLWKPEAARPGKATAVALAACQTPTNIAGLYSWRHRDQSFSGTQGANNHLYLGGEVETRIDPIHWKRE